MLILDPHSDFTSSKPASSSSEAKPQNLTVIPHKPRYAPMMEFFSSLFQHANQTNPHHTEPAEPEASDFSHTWWPLNWSHPIFSKPLNAEQLEANLFEEETRIRRYTAGQDRDYFLHLVGEARNAISAQPPRLMYAQQLAGHISSNIGFMKTVLPHILALLILLAYFGGLAYTILNSGFFHQFNNIEESPLHILFMAAYMGVAGGAVSMMFDFQKIFKKCQPPFLALIHLVLRPLVGGFLAAFMLSVLVSGILNDLIPSLFLTPFDPEQSPGKLFFGIFGLSFLFGFSERIPSMIIQRTFQSIKEDSNQPH